MILKHIRTRTLLPLLIYLFVFARNDFRATAKPQRFEAILQDVYNCKEPNPAYAKNRNMHNVTIYVVNGKRYINGSITIVKPTPYRNFSGRTFFINKGKREMKMQVTGVSCRNVFARTILVFSQISFSLKNCMLKEGTYEYTRVDLDKVLHALPNWHAPGNIIHQLQLVYNGATELCDEFVIEIKPT